jgi:pyrophosphatase PpaX
MSIKAILFDLDGTLRDSRDLIWETTQHTLKTHGVEADREEYRHVIYHLNDIHALYPESGSLDSYHDVFRAYIRDKETTVFLYDGVEELLKPLQKQGLKLAVVSAARSAPDFIARQGLADYFATIVSGGDSKEHKPHPEPVFVATQRLGIRADEAIMVGDTTADIEAGKAAGVAATIGITHGFADRTMLEDVGADYIVDTLEELEQVILELTQVR